MITQTRQQEIQRIWQDYQGLYIVAGILMGLFLFPLLELVINDLSQLLIGLVPEAIGIGFTVFFLDRIYKQREINELKKRLIREAGSQSNETAKAAIHWLRSENWLNNKTSLLNGALLFKANLLQANLVGAGLQQTNLRGANLQEADLSGANLQGADLTGANLQEADLMETTLQGANLTATNLQKSMIMDANLCKVDLRLSHLEGAFLFRANLEQVNLQHGHLSKAYLHGANLLQADLLGVKLNEVIWEDMVGRQIYTATLPDGTKWTPDTDMTRFTNPEHPDFWRPDVTDES